MVDNSILIETRNLKKYFKTGRGELHAVDDVNMKIVRGTTLGVVGESGCGKSTLGRVVLGLIEATSGEIYYEGENITNCGKRRMKELRKEMQIIFQDPYASLNPRMSVSEIIAEPLIVNGILSHRTDIEKRVGELMDTVGIARRLAYAYPHELDGGRRQRVGIARALSVNPKFIVCDEPVSALDVSIQAQVVNMFEELQDKLGVAYLFIAHDLLVVHHISDRIAVMYLGKMMEIADADELNGNPMHPYTLSLLSAVPIPDPETARHSKRIVLEGDVPSPLKMPTGCPFRTRCKYATEQCAKEMPPLSDRGSGHFVACWNK